MLVLSRKVNESIKAGDVEIFVLSIRGSTVRIGIRAPDSVHILRHDAIDRQKITPDVPCEKAA